MDPLIRTVIVEDEPLALRALRDLVIAEDGLELVGEAQDGKRAVELIREVDPELLFLDIHLPELTGLEVLERIESQPNVVFTTAHDEHAIVAFELGAVDYLLKPFGAERFKLAVERVRQGSEPHWDVTDLRDALEPASPLTRLFARQGRKIIPIRMDQVTRFQGGGDHVEVFVAGRSLLVSVTLSELEARLDPERFVRVHRSHIVNLDHVREIVVEDERRLRVECVDGGSVVASRDGSTRLRELIR